MKLNKDEYVVTAYASRASGPGWRNTPVWVVIRDNSTGRIREECIQPEHQTAGMRILYGISEQTHMAMVAEVAGLVSKKKKK